MAINMHYVFWLKAVKVVRVSKKVDFAHFEGFFSRTKRARRSQFAVFDRSCRDIFVCAIVIAIGQ